MGYTAEDHTQRALDLIADDPDDGALMDAIAHLKCARFDQIVMRDD